MVDIYDSIRDEGGNLVPGRTRLFISNVKADGSIDEYSYGVPFVPQSSGTIFIVDEWVVEQIYKLQFIDGVLSIKTGEELTAPERTAEDIEREQLLARLAELDAQQPTE